MLTKSNQLQQICRLAEKSTDLSWNQAQNGFERPVLPSNSIVFQPDHANQKKTYYPRESLAISRILWNAIYQMDRRLYSQDLRPLLNTIKEKNKWNYRRAIAFCSNGLCFNANGKPNYSSSTRALEQMLWTLYEIAEFS